MPNKFTLDLDQVDPEISDLLAAYSSGQRGKLTIDFMTQESGSDVFTASIESVSDISTPESGPEEEGTVLADDSDVSEDLPPPSLVIISKKSESSEEV